VIGKYGSDERPLIAADGHHEAAVHIVNSEYFVLRDLEISNNAGKPVPGLHGVWIELSNYGTAHGIRIDNLFVHDVTGSCTREEKDGGHAILIQNYHEDSSDTLLSNFDGLVVENCHIKNCSRSGIIFWGNWNCNNSVFQYNLSFNNDGGFLLVCNSGGWTPDWSIGNNGTIARYNISINDGLRNYKLKENYFSPVIHCTGPIKNSTLEKIDRTLISLPALQKPEIFVKFRILCP
jgi:hypothetical protein